MNTIVNTNNKRTYFLTLAVLAVLSAYPLINGVRIAYIHFNEGVIAPTQYAQYVVPYTAICVSLLFFTAIQPLFFTATIKRKMPGRWNDKLKRFSFFVSMIMAFGVFFVVERFFESIQIGTDGMALIDVPSLTPVTPEAVIPQITPIAPDTADLWQAVSCVASPDLLELPLTYEFEGDPIYVPQDNTYKIHYYLISLVLITMVCGLIYGIFKMRRAGDAGLSKRKPLFMQGVSTVVLVALCVFANTTAFFRQAAPIQTPLASFLTGLFFVILGAAVGVYAGSFLLKKGRMAGIVVPVLLSLFITVLMYVGEAAMMQGNLYRFGIGRFFEGLPGVALAPVDILIIVLSGVATWLALKAARKLTI